MALKALVLMGVLLLAQVVEPPELPPGQFCVHVTAQNPNPAHPCACHRECSDPDDPDRVVEQATCKQYCHKDHCHCPLHGCP